LGAFGSSLPPVPHNLGSGLCFPDVLLVGLRSPRVDGLAVGLVVLVLALANGFAALLQSTLRRAVADFVLALMGTQSKLYAAVVQRFPRGGARSQTMSDRMSANICRGTAASAIWKAK